jgi:hypothetical protein
MDYGMIVQVWRGNFLDATPMWRGRGDGSSRAAGAVQWFGNPRPALGKLASLQEKWPTDTAGTGLRMKGYQLDVHNQPTFRYRIYGTMVSDASRALNNGQGIHREITVENPQDGLYFQLAKGSTIKDLSKGLYLIDDQAYYVQPDDLRTWKPIVREVDGGKELLVPIRDRLSYTILF